ncbi:MAG TPA: lipoyl(octanoyl) transferase LipB [Tepidisphaeraceae bacterium]|nr:lipoyl(octanoyl) transferase LipB [Tepidisphaeraceae bacterium]
MNVRDLGLMEYRAARKLQEQAHAAVLAGGSEQLLFVEHPPVITLGRRPGIAKNILASSAELSRRHIDIVESDRGGDITFHGPGQLVAYPIIRLADHQLSVSGYVHLLEEIIANTLSDFGISSFTDPKAVGVWVRSPGHTSGAPAKIAAIGVRIRRGVTLHGLALNVTTDLSFFDLIVPCGLSNRQVTSLAKLLPENPPTMDEVKKKLTHRIIESFLQ